MFIKQSLNGLKHFQTSFDFNKSNKCDEGLRTALVGCANTRRAEHSWCRAKDLRLNKDRSKYAGQGVASGLPEPGGLGS
ncbi:hypothetical protein StoSoilA2_28740 [Arthrobacter sp. StoSoilA2]|nr:hypothetical protein StoSoilA2_28740 [Arthrobacter sp. StoSoilA2]